MFNQWKSLSILFNGEMFAQIKIPGGALSILFLLESFSFQSMEEFVLFFFSFLGSFAPPREHPDFFWGVFFLLLYTYIDLSLT